MNAPHDILPMAAWLEQAWLERYLERQLGKDEQAWFEAYLLDKPSVLELLEADSALRAVLHAEAQALGSSASVTEIASTARPDGGAGGRSSRRLAALRWPLAASFVLGLGMGVMALQPWRGGDSAGGFDHALAAAPSRLVFDALRGSYAEPRVDSGDPAALSMIVDIAVPLGSRITAAEAELAQGSTISLPAAPISSEGFATYSVPSAWRGKAQLRLQLATAEGETEPLSVSL